MFCSSRDEHGFNREVFRNAGLEAHSRHTDFKGASEPAPQVTVHPMLERHSPEHPCPPFSSRVEIQRYVNRYLPGKPSDLFFKDLFKRKS